MISILEDLFDSLYDKLQKAKIKRNVKFRIKELRSQFEWFEQIYRDEIAKKVMIEEIQAQNKIMNIDYMNQLDKEEKERIVFQEWLMERSKIL